jgi:RNA polymerase sigma factor (sigma-70 family)
MPKVGPVPATDVVTLDEQPSRDDAVEVLFRRLYPELLRLAYCLIADRPQAEDVVQDAFVSLYAHWDGLRDANAAPDYLRSAVFNRCRSRLRTLVRERAARPLRLAREADDSSEDVEMARDEGSRLVRAVQRLPRRQREVVACRYYLELSVAETAAQLDITVGSVKRHTHRAIEALIVRMEAVP